MNPLPASQQSRDSRDNLVSIRDLITDEIPTMDDLPFSTSGELLDTPQKIRQHLARIEECRHGELGKFREVTEIRP